MKKNSLIFLFTLVLANRVWANNPPTLSMGTFKRLGTIERLMVQEDYASAQRRLDKLLRNLPRSEVDKAYIFQTQAGLSLRREDYRQAAEFFARAYQLGVLADQTQASLARTLASLALQDEQYTRAVEYLRAHLALIDKPEKAALLALGSALYQLDRFAEAIAPLQRARRDYAPDKAVYLTLFSAHYEQRQLSEAARVLEAVLQHWPENPAHWRQLAGLYLELGQVGEALEILQLAHVQDYLRRQNEWLTFVYALYERGLPHKAALLLRQGLDAGLIESDYKWLRLLGSLLVEAREEEAAFEAFQRAAPLAGDGREYLELARLSLERGDYTRVLEYATEAIERGLEDAGGAWMLLAVARHERGEHAAVAPNLREAQRFAATREQAGEWLARLRDD